MNRILFVFLFAAIIFTGCSFLISQSEDDSPTPTPMVTATPVVEGTPSPSPSPTPAITYTISGTITFYSAIYKIPGTVYMMIYENEDSPIDQYSAIWQTTYNGFDSTIPYTLSGVPEGVYNGFLCYIDTDGNGIRDMGEPSKSYFLLDSNYIPVPITVNQNITQNLEINWLATINAYISTPYSNVDTNEEFTCEASYLTSDFGEISSTVWDFDDGTTATGESVTHSYTTAGTYNIKVTVSDDQGNSKDFVNQLNVVDDNHGMIGIEVN